MRGIVVDRATRVIAGALIEHLEGNAVADILARMDLVAEVDTGFLIGVEDRTPAAREFVERRLDQARRPLRPGIQAGQASAPVKLTLPVRPRRRDACAAFII